MVTYQCCMLLLNQNVSLERAALARPTTPIAMTRSPFLNFPEGPGTRTSPAISIPSTEYSISAFGWRHKLLTLLTVRKCREEVLVDPLPVQMIERRGADAHLHLRTLRLDRLVRLHFECGVRCWEDSSLRHGFLSALWIS